MEYLIALVLGLIVVEVYAWLSRVSQWIVELAVRLLPQEHRERWREEFQEGQNALPQTAWRFVNALALCYGALLMRRNLSIVDREDAVATLGEEVASALSIYRGMVSTLQATAAMSASSRGALRPALSKLQDQVLLLSDRLPEETYASVALSVKGLSEGLLNCTERAHDIHAAEIEKVSRALREIERSAADISRNWSFAQKMWQVSRCLPFVGPAVFTRFVLSVRDETSAFRESLKLDGVIDTASLNEAKGMTNALHQFVEKQRSDSK